MGTIVLSNCAKSIIKTSKNKSIGDIGISESENIITSIVSIVRRRE
jgi:hypothetical protein